MLYIYIMGHITILISVTPSPHPTTHPTARPNVCYTYHSWHITTVGSSRSVTPIIEPYKNTPSAIHSTVQSVLLVLVVNSGFKLYGPGLAKQTCPFLCTLVGSYGKLGSGSGKRLTYFICDELNDHHHSCKATCLLFCPL